RSSDLRVGVLVELVFPLLEKIVCDALDAIDPIRHGLSASFAALVRRIQPVVDLLEVAAVEADDAPVLLESRLELLLRVVLGVPGILDAIDEDVALLDTDRL